MAKVAISLPDELLESVDRYAKDNFQTRSGFISMCCNSFFQAQHMQRILGSMADSMAKLADASAEGSVEEDLLQEIQQFEKMAKLIVNRKM